MSGLKRMQRLCAAMGLALLMAVPQTAQAGGRYHKGGDGAGVIAGAAIGLVLGAIIGSGRHYAPAPRYHQTYRYSPRPVYRHYGHGGYGRQYHGYQRQSRRYHGYPRHHRRYYGHGHNGYRFYGH